MQILDLAGLPDHPVDDHGSFGFTVAPLGPEAPVSATVATLDAGGRIGRHPTPTGQVLVVVEGRVGVTGEDGEEVEITTGAAAHWEAGEEHLARAVTTAVVLLLEVVAGEDA
jgi:quercetin dioxygenase-like cupin family protein